MLTILINKRLICITLCFSFIFLNTYTNAQTILIQEDFQTLNDWNGFSWTSSNPVSGWYGITENEKLRVNIDGGSGQRIISTYYNELFNAAVNDTLVWQMSFMHSFSVSENLQSSNNSRLILAQNDSSVLSSDTLLYVELSNKLSLVLEINKEKNILNSYDTLLERDDWYRIEVRKEKANWYFKLNDTALDELSSSLVFPLNEFYVGINSLFSSGSRGRHFYYDDYFFEKIEEEEDDIPPYIEDYVIANSSTLILSSSELLDLGLCLGTIYINGQFVQFSLNENYEEIVIDYHFDVDSFYTVSVAGFCDSNHNILNDTTLDFYVEDSFPPKVDSLLIKTDFLLEVIFDEPIYQLDHDQLYLVTNKDSIGIINQLWKEENNVCQFILDQPLKPNRQYIFHFDSIGDVLGNRTSLKYPLYNDKRSPKIQTLKIISASSIELAFSEMISQDSKNRYNFIIDKNRILPDTVLSHGSTLSLFYPSNTFYQDSVYELSISNIQDRYGNEMYAKRIDLKFDTIPPFIEKVSDVDSIIRVKWNEKIVSIDSTNFIFTPILCPSKLMYCKKGDNLFLMGVSDENGNKTSLINIDYDTSLYVYDAYCISDSVVRVETDVLGLNNEFSIQSKKISSVTSFTHYYDINIEDKFEGGDTYFLNINDETFEFYFIENDYQTIHFTGNNSLTIFFEQDLLETDLSDISIYPELFIQQVIVEENKIHLFYQNQFVVDQIYQLKISNWRNCKNEYLADLEVHLFKDVTFPVLKKVEWKTTSTLTLSFDETILESSLDYRLEITQKGEQIPFDLRVRDAIVDLSFSEKIWGDTVYVNIDRGLSDLYGNVTEHPIKEKINPIYLPQYKDIVLSEIFADPTPIIGLPNSEAIELYNNRTDTLSLMGIQLIVGEDTLSMPNKMLNPHSYFLLIPESNRELWDDNLSIIGLKNWNALNNNGENIKLINSFNGSLVDSFSYDLTSYQDIDKSRGGYTLERRDFTFDCDPIINWKASVDSLGGSLGYQNSIFEVIEDTIPPNIINIESIDSNKFRLFFDEKVYIDSVKNAIKYIVNDVDNYVDKWFFVNNYTLELQINKDLPKGVLVTLVVDNFSDCFDNIVLSKNANFVIKPKINYQQLLITELMIDYSPINKLPESEYIEVYNNSDNYISIDRCTMLVDEDTVFFNENWIYPREYVILCPSDKVDFFDNLGIKNIGVVGWETLRNDRGEVHLLNEENEVIHQIFYTSDFYKNQSKQDGGWSLEMRDKQSPCLGSDNWQASIDERGGTPSEKNSIDETVIDHKSPKLDDVIYLEEEEKMIIQFSESIAVTSSTEIYINEEKIKLETLIEESHSIIISDIVLKNKNSFLSVNNIVDCSGNIMFESEEKRILFPVENGQLYLSEILYDPSTVNTDFVELHLSSSMGYFNLKDWSIANIRDQELIDEVSLSRYDQFIFDKEYIVFTSDKPTLLNFYPSILSENIYELNLPSFPNEEGGVAILYKGVIQETFIYSDSYHQAFLKNTEDISLERINFEMSASSKDNWTSAVESKGFATPTFINSRSSKNSSKENDHLLDQLSFSSKLITNNGDGIDDFLKIENISSSAIRILRLEIYDVYGKLIYPWLNNYELSSGDFIKWDGVDQYGSIVMGKYLVYFQMINTKGYVGEYTEVISLAPWN